MHHKNNHKTRNRNNRIARVTTSLLILMVTFISGGSEVALADTGDPATTLDLTMTSSDAALDTFKPGGVFQSIEYKIENTGSSSSDELLLKIGVPPDTMGEKYLTGSNAACDTVNSLQCIIEPVDPGSTRTIVFSWRSAFPPLVGAPAGSALDITATLEGNGAPLADFCVGSCVLTASPTVEETAIFEVTAEASPNPLAPGDSQVWNFSVTNTGEVDGYWDGHIRYAQDPNPIIKNINGHNPYFNGFVNLDNTPQCKGRDSPGGSPPAGYLTAGIVCNPTAPIAPGGTVSWSLDVELNNPAGDHWGPNEDRTLNLFFQVIGKNGGGGINMSNCKSAQYGDPGHCSTIEPITVFADSIPTVSVPIPAENPAQAGSNLDWELRVTNDSTTTPTPENAEVFVQIDKTVFGLSSGGLPELPEELVATNGWSCEQNGSGGDDGRSIYLCRGTAPLAPGASSTFSVTIPILEVIQGENGPIENTSAWIAAYTVAGDRNSTACWHGQTNASLSIGAGSSGIMGVPDPDLYDCGEVGLVDIEGGQLPQPARIYEVTKTSSKYNVGPDGVFDWIITVKNTGPVDGQERIELTDFYPFEDMELTGALDQRCQVRTEPGNPDPSDIFCDLDPLAAGQSTVITLPSEIVNPNVSEDYYNAVKIFAEFSNCETPWDQAPDEECYDFARVTTEPPAHLIATKTNNASNPLPPGEFFDWTITVTNVGQGIATDVHLYDEVPEGLGPYAGSIGGCTHGYGNPVECNLGDLAPGDSIALSFTLDVGIDFPQSAIDAGQFTNVANITSDNSNCVEGNDDEDCNPVDEVPIMLPASIELTKKASVNEAAPGDTFDWTVTATNNGPGSATNVHIEDFMPAEVRVVDMPNGCSSEEESDEEIHCGEIDIFEANTSLEWTFTVEVKDPFYPGGEDGSEWSVTNEVYLYAKNTDCPSSGGDDDETVCFAEDTVPITELEPNLAISKSSSEASVNPGDSFDWTITVTNNGEGTATEVLIYDELPEGTSPSTGGTLPGDCQYYSNDNIFECFVGDLPAGDSVTKTVTVTVDDPVPASVLAAGEIVNTASVTSKNGNCNLESPAEECSAKSIVEIKFPKAILEISKSANVDELFMETEFIWTVTVENKGTGIAENVRIVDNLPPNTLIEFSNNGMPSECNKTWNPADEAYEVICNMEDIAPGDSVSVDLGFRIPWFSIDQIRDNNILTNTATVTADNSNCPEDSDDLFCTTEDELPLYQANYNVTKVADVEAAGIGDEIVWTITIENDGIGPATYGSVWDNLPKGLHIDNITVDGVDINDQPQCIFNQYDPNNNEVGLFDCQFDSFLDGGESIEIIVVTTVEEYDYEFELGDPISWKNIVEIYTDNGNCYSGEGPSPNDCKAEAEVDPLLPESNLSVTKTSDVEEVYPGDTFDWTVTVINNGPDAADNVNLFDYLPDGVSVVAVDDACDDNTEFFGHIRCNLSEEETGELFEANETATFVFTVQVDGDIDSGLIQELTNHANVTGGSNCLEPSEPECFAEDTVILNSHEADLTISKTSPAVEPVKPGESFDWSITVTNDGQGTAENVVITDTLPDGTTPGVAPTGCDLVGNELTCNVGDLPAGDSVTKTVTVTVDDPVPAAVLAAGEVVNTASVTSENSNCPEDDPCSSTSIVEINPFADLDIQKSSSAPSVKPGESFDWTITVTNNGQGDATNVVITDTLPDGTTPGTAPAGCDLDGNKLTCNIGDLDSEESVTKTITVTADDPVPEAVLAAGEVSNTATVTADNSNCPVDDPCDSTVIVDITPEADLVISKTLPEADPVRPGTTFDWSIVVTNNGQGEATNVVITDTLPDGTTPGAAPAGCDLVGNELTCNVGTLAPGEAVAKTITVTADDPVPESVLIAGEVSNTAYVTSENSNCPEDDPCSSTSIVEINPFADIEIEKTSSAPSAIPGESFDWTIEITNNGQGDATDAVITDTLPEGVTPGTAPTGCILDGNELTCSVGDLPAGDSVTKTITVTVDDPVPAAVLAAGEVVNTASVTSENSNCPEADPCSSTSIVEVTPLADLEVSKTSSAASVIPGESFDWSITVTNNGQGDDTGVVITDTLPEGTTPDAAPTDCTLDGNELTCNVGDLPAGDSVTKTVTVTVDDPVPASVLAAGEVSNTAYVTDENGNCPSDDPCSSTSIVEITPLANLEINKTTPIESIIPGESFAWTIEVTNNGQGDDTGVVITDTLPVGVTPITTPAGCNLDGNELTCNIGDLTSGETTTKTIMVVVDDPVPTSVLAAGEVSNTATVTDENGNCPEADPCDSTSIVEITPEADLVIEKTSSAPSATPGESFDWSITVTNNGQGDDTGVVITDILPEGTTPGAAPADCTLDGNELTCEVGNLASGDSFTATISVTVDDPVPAAVLAAGEVSNTAHVTDENGNCPIDSPNEECSSTSIVKVTPLADLDVSKVSSAPSAKPGESFDWTIEVTNNGQGDDTGVVITDTLPEGTTPGAAPTDCVLDGNELTCEVGDLASGESVTKTISVTVDDPVPASVLAAGEVSNTAYVTDENGNCPSDDPCSSTSIVDITPEADLVIDKISSETSVEPGGSFDWTIEVTNNGQGDDTGVVITDTLPEGVTPGSAPNDCTLNGNELTCDVGDLASGESFTATVSVTVDDPVPADVLAAGEVSNTAYVTDDNGNCPEDDPCSSTSIVSLTPLADLDILKVSSAPSVTPGESFDWTIEVTNNGQGDDTGVVIIDTLPDGVTPDAAPTNCALDGNDITCEAGDLASGDSFIVTVSVTVDDPVPASVLAAGEVSNTAHVTDDNGNCPEDDPCSSTSIVEVTPLSDLVIAKTSSAPTAKPGESFDWSITVTNNGQGDDTGVVITDTLPEGTTPGAVPTDCVLDGNELTCNVGDLPAGDSITKTISVTVDDPVPAAVLAAGVVSNTAHVTDENGNCPEGDPNEECSSTSIVDITPLADLVIVKTSSAPSATPGETFDWSITVTNNGQGADTGVVITDTLPEGTTPDVAPDGCNIDGNELTCEIGDLASGESVTKTITVTVDDPVPASVLASGEVSNTAHVTDENGNCPEDDPCSSTSIVDITPEADLVITKTSSAPSAKPGESFDWSIEITNNGQGDATNVVIIDTLPDGITPGASPSGCDLVGNELTCAVGDLPAGDSVTKTISVTVDDPVPAAVLAAGEVSNTAIVTSDNSNCPEDDPCDSTSIVEITPEADLNVQKTSSAPSVTPGESFDWSITVTNNGQGDATNVIITDTFPEGTTPGATPSGCDLDGNELICNIGDLPAGDSVTKTITVTVDDPVPADVLAAGEVSNTATVTDENGNCPEEDPCDSTSIVEITPEGNLSVVKTSDVSSVIPGEEFVWSITVTNNGQGSATNTVVTDTLPDGTTFVSSTMECDVDGQDITCSIGDIATNESITIDFTVVADDPVPADVLAAGEVINTAYVTDDDSCPPGTENPDCSSTSIVEIDDPESVLVLAKSASIEQVEPLVEFYWTLVLTNISETGAQNVTIVDEMPDSVDIISVPDNCTVMADGRVSCLIDYIAAGESESIILNVRTVGVFPQEVIDSGQIINDAFIVTDDCPIDDPTEDCMTTAIVEVPPTPETPTTTTTTTTVPAPPTTVTTFNPPVATPPTNTPSTPELPRTGAKILPLILAGGALILMGGVIEVAFMRRRRNRTEKS